jgi:Spy/CpxP family protein refolding chaperone
MIFSAPPSNLTLKHTMKLIALIILLASLCPLFAADESKKGTDPFDGAFFPPELVLMARDRIALTQEQQDALRTRLEKTQPRSDELRSKLEKETAALAALAKQERVDEKALLAQLDKVLDVEREVKHLHIGLGVAIKNLLTPEQQAKLREIVKGGVEQLGEDVRKRLTEKVERVKAAATKMAEGGSDPSEILKAMEEKFKPLMEAGKASEAEAELDRVLEQLTKDVK